MPQAPKLLDQVRNEIQRRDYSPRTEQAYLGWIRRYIFFHAKQHPKDLGGEEVAAYLSWLGRGRKYSVATQKQALNALVFLYRRVLEIELGDFSHYLPARQPKRLPVILSRDELQAVFAELKGSSRLMAGLLYGSGLRLTECHQLRVQDVDLQTRQIVVRDGKGGKDRRTLIPEIIIPRLSRHLEQQKTFHQWNLAQGYGAVYLPRGIGRKYQNAATQWAWQWLFPSTSRLRDPETGAFKRWHLHPSGLQKAVKAAINKAGIGKHAGCHTFRHCFATHLLEDGCDIRTVQDLLGHKKVNTTMIYLHILNKGGRGVTSPLDKLVF